MFSRFLPLATLAAMLVVLAATAQGCTDRACFEWVQAQGPCPGQSDAPMFFGECSDVKKVLSPPTFESSDGLCCYDVTHVADDAFIDCPGLSSGALTGTTRRTSTTRRSSTFTSTTRTSTTPTFTPTSSTTGLGGGPPCITCAEALQSGNNGSICLGSQDAFAALSACACGDTCGTDCQDLCNVGGAPDAACNTCLGTNCSTELDACNAN